jgi:UrcA family protein
MLGVSIAAFVTLGSMAQAAEVMIRQDVEVRYSSNELVSEAGARGLLARIDHAAMEACGGPPYFNSLYSTAPLLVKKNFAECHDAAVNRAVATLNSPMLTQVFASNGYLYRVAGR